MSDGAIHPSITRVFGGMTLDSGVDSRGAGGAKAPPEFWGSEKGRSLISAYRSLAIIYSKHLWI